MRFPAAGRVGFFTPTFKALLTGGFMIIGVKIRSFSLITSRDITGALRILSNGFRIFRAAEPLCLPSCRCPPAEKKYLASRDGFPEPEYSWAQSHPEIFAPEIAAPSGMIYRIDRQRLEETLAAP